MGQASDIVTCTKPDAERDESLDTYEAHPEQDYATALALVTPAEIASPDETDAVMESAPEVLREQIEQTRAEMTETLDAIKTKLDPHLLMEEAKDKARAVTKEKATQALHFAKSHPVPVGIAGAVLSWLCVRAWSKRRHRNVAS
jgi:hypothetical protein